MPTLLWKRGYSFRFRASDRGESPHVHVSGNRGSAKVWLEPIRLASAKGYTQRQLGQIVEIIFEYQDEFVERWREFFG